MFFRRCFVAITFVLLLIWGPINYSWPGWLFIRIGYLILIPLIAWFLLYWLWKWWQPSEKLENVIDRILSGFVCIALSIFAFMEASSKSHIGNTKWVQTSDGMEAVGDDIILPGPDRETVLVIILIAIFVFLFGVLKIQLKEPKSKRTF